MSYRRYLLIPLLLLAGIPLLTTAQNAEGIIPGTLSVKFTAVAADALDISTEDAFVTTGFDSIDRLNARFGVTEMTRIFRPAGRFEERHRAFGLHRWYTLTIPQDVAVQTAVNAYQADPNIEIAEPVYEKTFSDGYDPDVEPRIADMLPRPTLTQSGFIEGVAGIPNDPRFGEQWHYHNTGQTPPGGTPDADIDLPEAHDIQTGDPSVIVSIHDMGIDVDHEDLAVNMWVNEGEIPGNDIDDDDNGYVDDVYGYNFADGQGTIVPGYHGVHVAGTVAAVTNNGVGVAGVAGGDGSPDSGVRLMSAQVFSDGSSGGFAESYAYAADMGAVISQNSWSYDRPGFFGEAVRDGIDYYIATAGSEPDASMDGGLVIFSAGNNNSRSDWYPAFYEPVVAVASTSIDDGKSGYSNFGEWVDVSAPGGTFEGGEYGVKDVLSTLVGNEYGYLAGTSMACPHASGVAALILSENLGTTNLQVRTILEFTTDDIDDVNPNHIGLLGTGRINALTAIQLQPDTTPPVAVADLAGTPDGNFATLAWTAPEDDGFGVRDYHMRYASSPIVTETDWDNATVIEAAEGMSPQESGETEELVITGLDFETTYHFGIRSFDGLNLSDLSNSEEVTTLASPTATVPTDPIAVTLFPEAQETRDYTISNVGPSTLSYTIDFVDMADGIERTPVPRPDSSDRQDAPPRDGVDDDSPAGEPQRMDEGGPDDFGYRWIDSNEPNGPTYDWVDITETGTEVELGADDHAIVDLPFDFPYYENTFDWVAIQSTGALSFVDATLHYANQQIPSEDAWNGLLAGYWDDLNPGASGAVYYDTLEDGRFVVSWVEVPHFPSAGTFTFQIILDANGGILYQYQTMDGGGSHDNSATVGIENLDGTDGLQVVYNAPYVEDGLAVQFSTWLRIDTRSGEVAAGEERTHTLSFYSGTLAAGEHTTDMIVTSNQAGGALTQEYVVPITLTVQGVGTEDGPAFEGTHRLSAVAPNPIGGLATATLEVAEAQDVTVELFDVRGRKVTTLLEGALAARTAEDIALDGSGLAPGVYVLRIVGETFSETRRVTIVR